MSEPLLHNLEQQIERLILRCQSLEQENHRFERRATEWKAERARLLRLRDGTQAKVEAMISRLKDMELE